MDWSVFIFLAFMNITAAQVPDDLNINRIIAIIQRRNHYQPKSFMGIPRRPEDLPEAEPILPGHTLIRPSLGMLQSAVKFPHRDFGGTAVYGNLNNLGTTYGKTNERVLYTDFRKSNNLLAKILQAVGKLNNKKGNNGAENLIVIEANPVQVNPNTFPDALTSSSNMEQIVEEENNANEILDESTFSNEDLDDSIDFRRKKKNRKQSKFRDRNKNYESSSDESGTSSSGSSDHDKNPGNPYTVHKNKYKQNFLWNQFMDGDHMNVNPYAPQLNTLGLSGADIFFGRKWWYFNQDDYKPMG